MSNSKSQALLQQARQLQREGKLEQASALCSRLRTTEPQNAEAVHLGGELALLRRDLPQSLLLLTQALRLNPANTICAVQLGQALLSAGRPDQAELILTHAVQTTPQASEAWTLLANVLRQQGRVQDALTACRRAVEAKPRWAEAHGQLGALLVDASGHAAGEPHFRKAAELEPREPTHWTNLGICIAYRKDLAEALPCFDKALALNPRFAKAYAGRGLVQERLYHMSEAVADYRRAIECDPQAWDARSCLLLNLHYLPDITREELLREHRAYGEAIAAALPPEPVAALPVPDPAAASGARPLRVGFLGPDFRAHSVAYFLEPLLAGLDPARFQIHLYHDHAGVDWMTERLRSLAAVWRHTAGIPHARLASLVREDKLDLLFDLAGHTGFNRLHTLARRLAPVQAAYMGYPDTTGLKTMDWRLTDALADPPDDSDAWHTERLLRFSDCAWCYAPSSKAPAVSPPPCTLPEGNITFGCFNNFTKVTDPLLAAWGRLLNAVPGSRLLIKNHGLETPRLRAEVLARCAAQGLPTQRVELAGRTELMEDHLAMYARVDISLDTYPYHGTTTTCEALWMGVPVVTLAGDRHCARVGCSLLSNAGHPEWIARDWTEYLSIAAGLAEDKEKLLQLRNSLRAGLAASIICDARGQAARFAKAIESMVRKPGTC